MIADELYQKAEAFIEAYDEAGLQSFILEHLAEFPSEDRDELVLSFFSGAMTASAEEEGSRHTFVYEALRALMSLEEIQRYIKDAVAEDGVRERLARNHV